MSGRISVVVLLAAVGAVLMAGCGGGEDTADATENLTRAEFIEQGDAICKKLSGQRDRQMQKFVKENDFSLGTASEKQLEELILQVAVPSLKQQNEEFNALGAPEGDEAQVKEIVTSWESATKEVEQDPVGAFENEPLEEGDALAKAYGFKFCGLD